MAISAESKVAIIGLGTIGRVLATIFPKGNRSVILSARALSTAQTLANEQGNLARPLAITAAIGEADVIILTIWVPPIQAFFQQYTSQLKGKIIVDPSNPIARDGKGGFVKTIGEAQSAGQILSGLLPKEAKLAKALGTLGAASLAQASGQKPELAV
ncbi:NADPH-dependent F420 reductase [Spirosoma aureum]|uniref:NADPH-dependent F420 reductase n=1 Tax=Spirosoma aureum TaxID=2692134 RepID=UPI0018D8A7F1|nr:NAD(P)-binding domain-containing protein [Spirosoma aureum]